MNVNHPHHIGIPREGTVTGHPDPRRALRQQVRLMWISGYRYRLMMRRFSAGNAPNAAGSLGALWPRHEEAEAELSAAVYYCPLCGEPAPSDSDAWLAEELLAYAMGVAAQAWMREIQRELKDAFGSSRRSGIRFEANPADIPEVPAALAEPSDMQIIGSPCSSYVPVRIPDDAPGPFHCLICGEQFAS
jgi:hypothetical protein